MPKEYSTAAQWHKGIFNLRLATDKPVYPYGILNTHTTLFIIEMWDPSRQVKAHNGRKQPSYETLYNTTAIADVSILKIIRII